MLKRPAPVCLLALALTACAGSPPPQNPQDHQEHVTIGAALTGAPADVGSVHLVVASGASCDGPTVFETDLTETATMFLEPGDYVACAVPMGSDGVPSNRCSAEPILFTVHPDESVSLDLVVHCSAAGEPDSGTSVSLTFNEAPHIDGVVIGRDEQCALNPQVSAHDPDGDELTIDWAVSDDGTAVHITVTDALGAKTHRTVLAPPCAEPPADLPVTVTAQGLGETPTGIFIEPGTTLHFRAEGTWCWGGGTDCSDADGTPGRPTSAELPVILGTLNFGTLIGRVGTQLIWIGKESTIQFAAEGELMLLMNDRVGFESDNSGSLEVTISPGQIPRR